MDLLYLCILVVYPNYFVLYIILFCIGQYYSVNLNNVISVVFHLHFTKIFYL